MNLQPVFRGENNLLRNDKLSRGEFARKLRSSDHLASGGSESVKHGRGSSSRAEANNGSTVGEFRGRPFHRLSLTEGFRLAAFRADTPKVAAVNIVLVRGVNHRAPVARDSDILDFKLAGREKCWCPAGSRNGIEVVPTVLFGSEDDAVAHEVERFAFGEIRERSG